jgi:hypothetical protein
MVHPPDSQDDTAITFQSRFLGSILNVTLSFKGSSTVRTFDGGGSAGLYLGPPPFATGDPYQGDFVISKDSITLATIPLDFTPIITTAQNPLTFHLDTPVWITATGLCGDGKRSFVFNIRTANKGHGAERGLTAVFTIVSGAVLTAFGYGSCAAEVASITREFGEVSSPYQAYAPYFRVTQLNIKADAGATSVLVRVDYTGVVQAGAVNHVTLDRLSFKGSVDSA